MPVTVLLLLFTISVVVAEPLRPMPIEALVSRADLVLHGTVISKQSRRDPEGRIYTRLEVLADEVWKGVLPANPMVIVHGGGVIGEETVSVSDQVSYRDGEEVVAFLRINRRHEGVTLSLAQGKFSVMPGPAGEKYVGSPYLGIGARPPGTATPNLSPAPARPDDSTWTLSHFRRRVQTLAGGGPGSGTEAPNHDSPLAALRKLAVVLAHPATFLPAGW